MRIDLNYRIPEATSYENRPSSARKTETSPYGEDSAKLSADHRVKTLSNVVIASSDVRDARVAALAKSIAAGTFQVTPEQTAEALLTSMLPAQFKQS